MKIGTTQLELLDCENKIASVFVIHSRFPYVACIRHSLNPRGTGI